MALSVPNSTSGLVLSYTGAATQDISISLWLYLPAISPIQYRQILDIEPSNIALSTGADGAKINYGTIAGDNLGPVLSVKRWYHIGMTVQNNSTTNRYIKGYLDGKTVVNVTDVTTFATASSITIGNYSNGSTFLYPFNGYLKDVRLWERVLTASEINNEMRSPVAVKTSGLLFSCPFEDNINIDKSGRGNNFTSSGSGGFTNVRGPRAGYPIKRYI